MKNENEEFIEKIKSITFGGFAPKPHKSQKLKSKHFFTSKNHESGCEISGIIEVSEVSPEVAPSRSEEQSFAA